MKTRLAVIGILCMLLIPAYANNPLRKAPYPQQDNIVYLNPAPLLVPPSMKQSDYLQFNLSQDKNFKGDNDILSKPVPWCMFNPHKILDTGLWYCAFVRSAKPGERCLEQDIQFHYRRKHSTVCNSFVRSIPEQHS